MPYFLIGRTKGGLRERRRLYGEIMKTNGLEAEEARIEIMLNNLRRQSYLAEARQTEEILNMVPGYYYCRNCRKLYPHKECKSYIEMDDGYPGDFVKVCPKGHEY